MTNSNRFLNRLFVFVVGLVLLVAGGAVAVGALLPDVQQTVSDAARQAGQPAADALQSQPWILWVVALAAVVLILLLLNFVLRHGQGRTSTLIRLSESDGANTPSGGSLVIDTKVASQLLDDALSRDSNIVSVDVTGFTVKGENVLRITAHVRRGASPVDVRRSVDRAVSDLDALLGADVPVFVQIVSGLRSQMTGGSARVA